MSMPPPPPPSSPNWSAPPAPTFATPNRFAAYGPRKPRFKVGIGLMIAATVTGIGLGAWVAVEGIGALTRSAVTTLPGTVDVSCSAGDEWRIGPLTGTTSGGGPVTITDGTDVQLDTIEATTDDGTRLDVRPMNGSVSETLTLGGDHFTAIATFRCTTATTVHVAITGTPGGEAAVFAGLGQTFKRLVAPLLGMAAAFAMGIVGLVMAITGRRRIIN